jgi:hypothetical protein
MLGRCGRISLLVFQVVWLNVVLPGHTRGVIALPGSGDSVQKSAGCCAKDHREEKSPAKPRAGACAVCFFAARLSFPDVIDLTPPALGLVDVVDVPRAAEVHLAPLTIPFDNRGPPHV